MVLSDAALVTELSNQLGYANTVEAMQLRINQMLQHNYNCLFVAVCNNTSPDQVAFTWKAPVLAACNIKFYDPPDYITKGYEVSPLISYTSLFIELKLKPNI